MQQKDKPAGTVGSLSNSLLQRKFIFLERGETIVLRIVVHVHL